MVSPLVFYQLALFVLVCLFVMLHLTWVVYLSPADISAGPVWSCPRDVNRTVLSSHIGFPRPGLSRLLYP
jgi:hypothetical protein